jgi:hypothetical protein
MIPYLDNDNFQHQSVHFRAIWTRVPSVTSAFHHRATVGVVVVAHSWIGTGTSTPGSAVGFKATW